MPKNTIKIDAVLRTVTSQTQQYKPFGYELDFTGAFEGHPVVVQVEIPSDGIEDTSKKLLVLNMEGFKAILVSMANVLDEVEAMYKKKYIK